MEKQSKPQNSSNIMDRDSPGLKQRNRTRKRKRLSSESSTESELILPENTLEVENNLQASAVRNNLDSISVRKIIKRVVTNDHVLAFVKLKEEEENNESNDINQVQKLTRAKVKELTKVSPNSSPWNIQNLELTPIKRIPVKTRPEVTALIAQELPEDEDDDEYQPTHEDVPSDDDHTLEAGSDLDSLPHTPVTSCEPSPKVTKDGLFKIPQNLNTVNRKLELNEEATIALRTRSKLSLSETPIEHIESSFIPPDEVPLPEVDDIWNEFLAECLNPTSVSKNEDDDEADPEYNVAADPDAHDEDEALEETIIKISKKELNDLVTELFNIMPEDTNDGSDMNSRNTETNANVTPLCSIRNEVVGKQEPISDDEVEKSNILHDRQQRNSMELISIGKTEPQEEQEEENDQNTDIIEIKEESSGSRIELTLNKSVNINVQETIPHVIINTTEASIQPPAPLIRALKKPVDAVHNIVVDRCVNIEPDQVLIIQQQLRQHIQIATSNFMQLCIHPFHWQLANTYKEYLEALCKIGIMNPKSLVNVCNLKPAWELITEWEKSVTEDTAENVEMVKFIQEQCERNQRRSLNNAPYVGEFHKKFLKVVANSHVFLYPYLLPAIPYRSEFKRKIRHTHSEDEYIALGLKQFSEYIDANPEIYKRPRNVNPQHRWGLQNIVRLINKYMLPWQTFTVLTRHIQFVRKHGDADNPIRLFLKTQQVKPVKHVLLPFNPNNTLYDQSEVEIPRLWLRYLATSHKKYRDQLCRPPFGGRLPTESVISQSTPGSVFNEAELNTNRKVTAGTDDNKGLVAVNIFTLVQTNNGALLLPLSTMNKDLIVQNNDTENNKVQSVVITDEMDSDLKRVNSSELIITDKMENNFERDEILNKSTEENSFEFDDPNHCKCCLLYTKLFRQQKTMTDYFKPKNCVIPKKCICEEKKYPRISSKMRLLQSFYKSDSKYAWSALGSKVSSTKIVTSASKDLGDKFNYQIDTVMPSSMDEIVSVLSYNLRLQNRAATARKPSTKREIYRVLSRFDFGNPKWLAKAMYKAMGVQLVDMYKEFIGFLTPDQADDMNKFKDYFKYNHLSDFVKKVEEEIKDKRKQKEVLKRLQSTLMLENTTACEICSNLLPHLIGYSNLARYLVLLFPHRTRRKCNQAKDSADDKLNNLKKENEIIPDVVSSDSLLDKDNQIPSCDVENAHEPHCVKILKVESEDTKVNQVHSENENNVADENENFDSSDSEMSIMIMSEDESIKTEPQEWKREEDKLILEVIKDVFTPEEKKTKTILETINEKNVVQLIYEKLTERSKPVIRTRVMYLLELLAFSEK